MTLRFKDTIEGKISNATNADAVPWSGVSGKPSTFTPSSHTHDDRYYTESEINSKLNGKANSSHTHTKSQITDFPTSMPASDVYAWAKASSKPSYSKSEIGLGNVDNTADSTKSVKYAASAGNANKCNNVIYTHQNEINFSGGKQPTCYFNYRNADSDASDGGTTAITYKFCNYTSNTAYSTIEANNFVGKINGNTVSKSVPSNADFSNDKVAQTAVKNTDYSDWRSLVWGASHSSTEGFTPTSVTDNLFSTNTLSVQPSTGTIKATTFKGNLTGKATSAGSSDTATKATSADSATRASSADKAIEIADYNNTNQGIKIGYAGDGFTASDFQYALGMSSERKIKDVSQAEYRKWLGLGSAAYTSSGAYAAASHSHDDRYYTESEMNTKLNAKAASDIVTISSTQPTSNTCKIWIKI